MMRWVKGLALAASVGALGLLWSCDRDGAAPARDHSGSALAATPSKSAGARPSGPTPMLDGKPIWADNRKHTAQENLDYQFAQWGGALGAKDAKDYAKRARAFVDHPPKGAEKVVRGNGDTLLYDEKSNTFAIYRRDGAPRLYRKPANGKADWLKAKSEADASPGQGGGRRYHAPSAGDYRAGASE